jgi:hypothetical protein
MEGMPSGLGPDTNYPEVIVVLLSHSRQIIGQYLKLGYNHFLPHTL